MYQKVKIDKRIGKKKPELQSWCKWAVGKRNPNWAGDKIKYGGIHRWINNKLGKPQKCKKCGTTKAKKYDWANKSGKYKRKLNDWIRLCRSCHLKMDNTAAKHKRDKLGRFSK